MNMISTGSFRTEANASTKQEELMKVLTAAWEKKNSKAARTGGVSLMALSLAACGGSSEDTTPFDQAHVDAEKALSYDAGYDAATNEAVELVTGLTTSNNTLTATNAELTTANAELTTANAELTTTNANLTTANADLTTDIQTANATITTINDTAHATEQAAYNAGETAGAASRDDEVNTLTADLATANSTITTIDNTAHASEQDAYDAGVASLQATVDAYNALVAQNALDAARTLDADGGAITLSTSGTIIVSGTTAGADTLNATVDAGGNATVIFDFSDAEDTVVLTSADLTGVTAIEVQDGTVDFTAVGSMDGIALTLGSGAVLTAAQATGLASIGARDGAASYDLTVNVSAGDDIDALTTALTAAGAGGNVTVAADDGVLTPAQSTALGAVATVENASGGAVVTTNAAPVIADAETAALTGAGAMTAAATVTDAEGNWNGGTITVSIENGFFLGDDVNGGADDAEGLTVNAAAGQGGTYTYSTVNTSIIADNGTVGIIVGTISNGGATTSATGTGNQSVVYTSGTITLNENATNEIVSDLMQLIRIEDAVGSDGLNDEATVTMTVTDADGASDSFSLLMDSDGASSLDDLNDDREVEAADMSAGTLVIDSTAGGDVAATITNAGLDLDGATMTIASSISGDEIDATPAGYTVASGNLMEGGDIIGTISGDGSDSVTITFNSNANDANVNAIIQGATITGTGNGAHDVTTTITEASGDSSVTETTTLTVVGDFTAVTLDELATADASANPSTAVTIDGNINLAIAATNLTADLDAQIAAGNVIISGDNLVRVTVTGSRDISGITGLESLGDLTLSTAAGTVTMDAAQAAAFGTSSIAGSITVDDAETALAADYSGLTAGGTLTLQFTTADADDDITFTGNLNSATVSVTGGGDFTSTAANLDGAAVTVGGGGALVVSDPANLAGVDLSNHVTAPTVLFSGDVTIANDANTNLGAASLTVDDSSTLTIDAAAVSGKTVNATNAATYADTGSSVVVTGLTATSDLSNISAGTNGGQVGATAGSLSTTISEDLTFSGDFGDFVVTVAEGATLTAAGNADVSGETIGGAGTVVVNAAGGADLDLGNVTASTVSVAYALDADVSADTVDYNTASIALSATVASVTLTATAAQVTGKTISGEAAEAGETGGSVVVTLDGAADYDLSNISAGAVGAGTAGTLTANIDVDGNVTLDADTNLGDFSVVIADSTGGDEALTISAAQASGLTIANTNNEDFIVTGLTNANSDFSNMTVNGTGTLTATGSESLDLSSVNVGDLSAIELDDGDNAADAITAYTVTLTAEQAAQMTDTGASTVTTAGGGGNDTVVLTVNTSTVDYDEVANGGNGNDDESDDTGLTIGGSTGADTIYASAAIDTITAGDGGSTIYGLGGGDGITGGNGVDNIFGGAGGDNIAGGGGADVISGGDGDDTITGGTGADSLTGGDGDDTFVIDVAALAAGAYTSSDSGVGSVGRDVIADFEGAGVAGGDDISLNGNTAGLTFSFIATNAFSGTGAEVRYQVTGSDSLVEFDADSDGITDFQLLIQNVDGLVAGDFTF
jgi:Ca2+-binding RTX toxin-like protein